MNVLPWPGALTSRISPPSSRDSSRLIARPRPVPPYLRLVRPSACWNASKMICCLSRRDADAGVASPRTRCTVGARFSSSLSGLQPLGAGSTVQRHLALVRELERVGQQVLEDLLQPLGVGVDRRAAGSGRASIVKSSVLATRPRGGTCARRSRAGRRAAARRRPPTTVPDSIFDRSRMSLMSVSRSLPDEWIVLANSTCFGGQVAVGVLARAGRTG